MRWQIAAVDPSTMATKGYHVLSVAKNEEHEFSKKQQPEIRLLKGLGVEGDAHCGERVKHRSRVRVNPDQPNLRQVHLIAAETLDELSEQDFVVAPGDLGENITTLGINLLSLPTNTHIRIGDKAILTLKGLRNPCPQLDGFQAGLMKALLDTDSQGNKVLKAGVMAVVTEGGVIKPGDHIRVSLPAKPYQPLKRV